MLRAFHFPLLALEFYHFNENHIIIHFIASPGRPMLTYNDILTLIALLRGDMRLKLTWGEKAISIYYLKVHNFYFMNNVYCMNYRVVANGCEYEYT